jgi:holo-[acyl-carrier protein] synthase
MIEGIGNDIIEVARIEAILQRYEKRFLNRLFTMQEQAYCLNKKHPALHFAGRFAAKEAIAKALGTGFRKGLTWLDIEILNDEYGKPIVILSHSVSANFCHPSIFISISHCHQYATAFAICISSANGYKPNV